jgi:competence protein ComEA
LAHREANGPFGSPEDLLQVSGIGAKTLARMADAVVVR